jgi:prefoldin subunit 5
MADAKPIVVAAVEIEMALNAAKEHINEAYESLQDISCESMSKLSLANTEEKLMSMYSQCQQIVQEMQALHEHYAREAQNV